MPDIPGETGPSYTPTDADLDMRLRYRERVVGPGGTSDWVYTEWSQPIGLPQSGGEGEGGTAATITISAAGAGQALMGDETAEDLSGGSDTTLTITAGGDGVSTIPETVPEVVATGPHAATTVDSDLVITVPAGGSTDDLLVVPIVDRYGPGATVHREPVTVTPPTGAVKLAEHGRDQLHIQVFGIPFTGQTTLTFTCTESSTEVWHGACVIVSDIDLASMTGAAFIGEDRGLTGGTAEFTPSSITTTVDNSLVMSLIGSDDDNALSVPMDQDFTILASGAAYDTTIGNDSALGIAARSVLSAGTTVTMPTWQQTINVTPDPWASIVIELVPVEPATVSYAWPEADGTAWPTEAALGSGQPFLDVHSSSGGTHTHQAGWGRLTLGGTLDPWMVAELNYAPWANFEFQADVRWPSLTDNPIARIEGRYTDANFTGYRVELRPETNTVRLQRLNAPTTLVDEQAIPGGIVAGSSYRLKWYAIDGSLRVKVWVIGTAEPSTWLIDATDATPYTSGTLQFGLTVPSGVTSSASIEWDNVRALKVVTPPEDTPTLEEDFDAVADNTSWDDI